MRILVLSIDYWPDESAIAAFNTGRCEYLASRGHEVTICTGPPYYPEWRVPEAYRALPWQREAWQTERHNDVTILRSWMYVPAEVTTKRRMLHEASFLAASLLRVLGNGRPEVIVAVSPPLGLALTVSLLARMWRVPYVFDVEDLQPDAALERGMMADGTLIRLLYRLERLGYERAALVSTLTEGMRQRIAEKGIDPAKVVLFPPRADPSLFDVRRSSDAEGFRRRYKLQGKRIVSHSGNMGAKEGLDVVLGAAERTRESRPEIRYLFVGDGAARVRLEQRARARELPNVLFLPRLERNEFHRMLAATDIALVTQQRVASNILFPAKTVTLLCAGCPVIASVNAESEVAHAVLGSHAGEVVEPENSAALAGAIERLSGSPETLSLMSEQAQQYAWLHWDEQRTLPRMEEELMRCVERWRDGTSRRMPAV